MWNYIKKIEKEEFKGDSIRLFDNYKKAKDIIEKKYQKENFGNLNDISKFINFRKVSYGKIDDVSINFYKILFHIVWIEKKIFVNYVKMKNIL